MTYTREQDRNHIWYFCLTRSSFKARKLHHPGGISESVVEETVTFRKANIKSPTQIQKGTSGICQPCIHFKWVPPVCFFVLYYRLGGGQQISFRRYQRCFLLCLRPPDSTIVQIHNDHKEIKSFSIRNHIFISLLHLSDFQIYITSSSQ